MSRDSQSSLQERSRRAPSPSRSVLEFVGNTCLRGGMNVFVWRHFVGKAFVIGKTRRRAEEPQADR